MKRSPVLVIALAAGFLPGGARIAADDSLVRDSPQRGDFPLVTKGRAASIVTSESDHKAALISARDLASDIESVTGVRPEVRTTSAGERNPEVLVGTLGRHPAIDAMVSAGQLDVSALRGAWESFVVATAVRSPAGPPSLVIVGSDRRGTAFGAYELSQQIGVSPWHWWSDVLPATRSSLFVKAGTRRFGPPSVKYRGIFINDEDWGLQPWAAKTFEPETSDIGPKTYAKVFELMLRLKANTLWPAMHAITKPFNSFPEHKRLADDYAIVMGSSHAEPMLRNNVGEWKAPAETYNYVTNRDGVRAYWEERVRENGRFENIYTLGMRGIHDSNMQGPRTDSERISTLERIFEDQRALIAAHVRPEIEKVPQMFCAYKEVLSLYRQGLKVPDDVTIVWPDDNHGYIRNYASPEERKRPGGFGVYYHLSYLGAPMSYLWLATTPPAVIWSEMKRAYDHGARTIWIANVGDIKPAEIETEFFLDMAWDIERFRPENLDSFLDDFAGREFGPGAAREIASILREYYRLNFQRRPEHLQWWLPREAPRASPFTDEEDDERLEAFAQLTKRAMAAGRGLPREKQDAYFQLIRYPVEGSAQANARFLFGERGEAELARHADDVLRDLTKEFGTIANGKWRDLMRLEPADDQWKSMRIAPWQMPTYPTKPAAESQPAATEIHALETERFTRRKPGRDGSTWTVIPRLGRTGDAVTILPSTASSTSIERLTVDAPTLEYAVTFKSAGDYSVTANLLPTHPVSGTSLRFAIAIGGQPPQLVSLEVGDGGPDWAQGVLNATRVARAEIKVPRAGRNVLRIFGVDSGVVLDKVVIHRGDLPTSYLGPETTPRRSVER